MGQPAILQGTGLDHADAEQQIYVRTARAVKATFLAVPNC